MTSPAPPPPWSELGVTDRALFLDVDGTLLEFASRPTHVLAEPALISSLTDSQRRLSGALALISGRALDDIDSLFTPWRPNAAAVHGVVVRCNGEVRSHAPSEHALQRLRLGAQQICDRLSGTWLEDKSVGVAIHFRDRPDLEPEVERAVHQLVTDLAPDFDHQPGTYVDEIRPSGFTKGTAVLELLAQPPFLGRRPVVVGDDLTDEDAFAAANAHDGVSIVVGSREPSAARYRLPDPTSVRRWLAQLTEVAE